MEKIDSWDFKMVQFNAYGVADLSYELAEEFLLTFLIKEHFLVKVNSSKSIWIL